MANLIAVNNSTRHSTGWAERHNDAINHPNSTEKSLVSLIEDGWYGYASYHRVRFNSAIGEDYVFGPAWAEIGRSLLTLLNGELGRLDAGTCDAFVRDVMKENGVEVED